MDMIEYDVIKNAVTSIRDKKNNSGITDIARSLDEAVIEALGRKCHINVLLKDSTSVFSVYDIDRSILYEYTTDANNNSTFSAKIVEVVH